MPPVTTRTTDDPISKEEMCTGCGHPPHLHDGAKDSCRVIYPLGREAHRILMSNARSYARSDGASGTALVICGCSKFWKE